MEIRLSGFANEGGIYKITNKQNNRIYLVQLLVSRRDSKNIKMILR